jgi:hypothetical protein
VNCKRHLSAVSCQLLLALSGVPVLASRAQPWTNLSALAQQPFLLPLTNAAIAPPVKGVIDLNPAHATTPRVIIKIAASAGGLSSASPTNGLGTNVTLTAATSDTNANAFNFYSTTDDVVYVLLATNVAGGSITLSNQIGTNYYTATATDTNGVFGESDFTCDLQFPPPGPVTNVITVAYQKTFTNPPGTRFFRLQTSPDLLHWRSECGLTITNTILQ